MSDIAAFLTACWDELEAIARDALINPAGRWVTTSVTGPIARRNWSARTE